MEPTKSIWMDGDLVPWAEANVHVLTHALHYGTGVFEGIRAYENPKGLAGFRLRDHLERLRFSADAYAMPLEYSTDDLMAAVGVTIRDNELGSCYIRPITFYELGTIGLNPSGARLRTSIVAFPWGAYLGEEGIRNGIRVKIASWARISLDSFPAAKATGPYINSILANQEAVSEGYDEALLLTTDGNVSEGAGENLFLIKDGHIITPPLSDGCLAGITRSSVMTLLEDDGHPVLEKSISPDDLFTADELFFTGTAAEVTPIREVDTTVIGKPGPITRRAQELYGDAINGRLARYDEWLDYF